MNKIKARKKYFKLREKLDNEQLVSKSISIANNALNLPIWEFNFFHIFLSIQNKVEVDTTPIINILIGKDKEILISKSDFNNLSMKSYIFNEKTLLKKNKYGIPEPINGKEFKENIDVIFIPLLAYDKKGNRVGYGKGFYDRFLSTQKNNIIKECYQKAQHYINLASNSLSLFSDCEEKRILKNLTSFSLARNF